ncbi:SIR2 family protein [Alcanivorax sp. JB21]|uniref:SIR2 family protein n=1 Tax=Alcanivorax limicola TaxID=2874102 RepID=UPI001CBEA760|nr:SIR2 family protein [Alcanivorax limicola]MBZ2189522.1 SIR2 family protein [Alcanivorax limicola]
MRFFANGPAIPDLLLERCDAGRVVFLCGAGVSLPSGMPSFIGLTRHVIDFFDPESSSEIMTAFQPWLDEPSAANVPLDQIFNLLHQEYGKNEVNALVTERLRSEHMAGGVGREHGLIKRISSNPHGVPQVVTTNFDLLFEADEVADFKVHVPPAFPDLALGAPVDGVTYLHGRLASVEADQHAYVLSSADFGRAYLSEAWATNFVRNLLEYYTVVLVGYQAEDPPVKYLLQGLNHDDQFDRSRLYAFDKGRPEDIEAKWRDRGVTAIAYEDHFQLWETLEAWAVRADDPRAWRAGVLDSTYSDPKVLAPHERGKVAHVLRSVQGAKIFSEIDPLPHPEWICVLDGVVRSAKAAGGYSQDVETFSPYLAYGLDDDLERGEEAGYLREIRNDDLLEWREGDDNPADFHCLGDRQIEGQEAIPPRLWHMMKWIDRSIRSPVIAWWAAQKKGLHPRLIAQLRLSLWREEDLDEKARHVWSLILECHRDARNRDWGESWFHLNRRIAKEGWTGSVLRDLDRALQPRLAMAQPLGVRRSKPPPERWAETNIEDVVMFEVKLLDMHGQGLDVPDEMISDVLRILEYQISAASGTLTDLDVASFATPTVYPGREMDDGEGDLSSVEVLILFVKIYDRLVALDPDLAKVHAMTWDQGDKYFFRKLKLYALSKPNVFSAVRAVEVLMSFDQESFWDFGVARELLFLVEDRWPEFSVADKDRLAERLLAGPDQRFYWADGAYPEIRDGIIARYGRYLQLKGCGLSEPHSAALEKIISDIPDWDDSLAVSTVAQYGLHIGWVGTDESPAAILDLPVGEIVAMAKVKTGLERGFGNFNEERPFTGLVKINPRKALAALTAAARSGEYPAAFWSALIAEMPKETSPRFKLLYLHRLRNLPCPVVVELRYVLGRWLGRNFTAAIELDEQLALQLYDHIVDCVLAAGDEVSRSATGGVLQVGESLERSTRTYDQAINAPLGMCAEALIQAVLGETQEKGSSVPDHIKLRLERLFSAGGEGANHAVAICMRRLNRLMHVDPAWTEVRLLPMLAFDHPATEPAWSGFLHTSGVPSPQLVVLLKPLLLKLYPWIEAFYWKADVSDAPALWLAHMCVFAEGEACGLTQKEMKSALRRMSDGVRSHVIFWLCEVGGSKDDGWNRVVIPFIENVWPRERKFRTGSSSLSWIRLLARAEGDFPAVYSAVKRFLVPFEGGSHALHRFMRGGMESDPITVRYPDATLDFMNTVTPQTLTRAPYDLPKILALIAEAKPDLTADPRYLRLIDLVERY